MSLINETAAESRNPIGTREYLGLALLLFVAATLRLHALGSQSVWNDEAYSLRLAALKVQDIVRETARDNHPPLYYLLLAAWDRMGPVGETWARALSAALGVALVGLFYGFCREVLDATTALLASALLTLSPLAVWHSQDARMYALMLAFMYLALFLFLRHLRTGSLSSMVLSTLALIGALYTHVYSVFALPGFAVHLFWTRKETPVRRTRAAAAALGVALMSYVPWVGVVLTSAMHTAGFYKPISLFSVPYTFYAFSVGYTLGPSVAELHTLWHGSAVLGHLGPSVALTAVAFGTAVVLGVLTLIRRPGRFVPLILSLLVFPILLPVAVTLVSRIDFNARYAILAFPAYLLLVAAGLRSVRPAVLRLLMGLGVSILMFVSLKNHYTESTYAKEDTRSAYKLVERGWRPEDCIFVIGVQPAFEYYAQASPIQGTWIDFRSSQGAAGSEKRLQESEGTCHRAWLVSGREWEDDPLGLAVPTLHKFFDTTSEQAVPGVRILELRPRQRSISGSSGQPALVSTAVLSNPCSEFHKRNSETAESHGPLPSIEANPRVGGRSPHGADIAFD